MKFVWYFVGSSLFFSNAVWARGGTKPPSIPDTPVQSPALSTKDHIVSNITFSKDGKTFEIHYADIVVSDPLKVCPLETAPASLLIAVNQLASKVRDVVSKVKDSRGPQCQALQSRIESTQTQIGTAIQYHFIASNSVTADVTQDKINAQTQQASAVNAFLLTASDMFHRECISSMDDKIVIQKLIGQIITLGGLFMGGWQGLAAATGGQVLGNLPIFRDEIDKALEIFQQYDEKSQRGSFLCLYRQMQKITTLLFASQKDTIINGLDLSFETGPAHTTLESVAKIRAESPRILDDIVMLQKLEQSSDELIAQMEKPEALPKGSLELFHGLRKWCSKSQLEDFKAAEQIKEATRESLLKSLSSIQAICGGLNAFQWNARTQSEMVELLNTAYWNISVLRYYYQALRSDADSVNGKIAKTWESSKYFENLKKSFEEYRDSKSGNQARLNYYRLTKNLGNTLTKNSFKKLMKENYKSFTKHGWFDKTPVHSLEYRQRVLKAMIDLCQTLDPTLTQLFIDDPTHNALQKFWKKSCVGPESTVCKGVLGAQDQDKLLDHLDYKIYFNSLCGLKAS